MTQNELTTLLNLIQTIPSSQQSEQFTATILKLAADSAALASMQSMTAEEKKEKKITSVQFTQKEINSMPQNYRKIFKVGTVVAHVYKTKANVYEVRCQINNVKYFGSSKKLEVAKQKFIEDLYKPIQETTTPVVEVPTQNSDNAVKISAFAYFMHWLENAKKSTIKETTYKGYLQLANKNVKEIFEDRTLKSITTLYLQTKFNEVIQKKQFRTATKLKNLLGDMFKFAVGNGDIPLNPMANIVVPKYDENHGEAITREEEKYIVNELIETGNKYLQAIVFLAYTGMRIGELASAKYDENGWVTCVSEKVRFGLKDKIRHIPISPMLKKVIDHIDIELISSISRDVIIKKIKDFLPERTTKDLRHTFITRCRECKIQREITSVWSGHVSDNSMTTKVYTHLAQNKELQLEEIALFNYKL
jgi:integrase